MGYNTTVQLVQTWICDQTVHWYRAVKKFSGSGETKTAQNVDDLMTRP